MTRLGIFNGRVYGTEEVSFQHLTGENWENGQMLKIKAAVNPRLNLYW